MTATPLVLRSPTRLLTLLALCAALLTDPTLLNAQTARVVPKPSEQAYAGVITVDVDLTDLERKIMAVRQSLPVRPGPLTLLYPRWIPGTHSPTGSVSQLAGLHITAKGQKLEWRRDTLDMYAFHLDVPAGVSSLELSFQHLSPVSEASGRVVMTPEIIGLQWNTVVLYPAGHDASAIQVRPSARLPRDWKLASALDERAREDDRVHFEDVTLETLVDSPLWAGKYTQRVALDTEGSAPVYLNLFADSPTSLKASTEQLDAHKALVQQADRLYGSRHFKRYEFLLALSEYFTGIGLEHSESSENGVRPNYFTEWAKSAPRRTLLPHEYTHSWNGKFRRPSDLNTPNFNEPMQDSLLWMYEGQTQYWGYVLSARSGLVSVADSMDSLAQTAAWLDARAGRTWRNLQDTTNEPIISRRGAQDWRDWQRGSDYYDEGTLIWLDADTKIRELSSGKTSLNDVAKAFFGVENGRVKILPYGFDDVVRALNTAAPHDWATFLHQRLDSHAQPAPLDGLTRGGWKLVYSEQQSEYAKASEATRKNTGFGYSLGFDLDKDGKLTQVRWGGPAFRAGLTPAVQLVAVNGFAYKPDLLREAITQAKDGSGVELLIKAADRYRSVKIDYRDGLRYPKLERIAGTPDRVTEILSAMK
ncbi:MAG: M61 family metallopeptidase [Rhodoferax sp.]|nr:M61 family metallopeptidase [Rhodoferax sp.]